MHLFLNTKYKSIRMGKDAGLLVWAEKHPVSTVKWTEDNGPFTGGEKLYDCFEVLAVGSKPTFAISVRFKDITTAIYVRDLQTGIYIAQGSIYFGLNKEEGKVEIKDGTGFAKQLKHQQSAKKRL